jgi:hypothetical protein
MNELIELKGLELLKIEVEKELKGYELIFIEDDKTYKEAKNQRASLNKLSKAVDTERKRITKELKSQLDSIIDLIPTTILDNNIKDWEKQLEDLRMQEIEIFYNELGFPIQVTLDRIFSDKWLNQTVDYKKELMLLKNKISNDLEVVKMINNSKEFLELYFQTLEVTDAKKLWDEKHININRSERQLFFNATDEEYQKVLDFIKSLGL